MDFWFYISANRRAVLLQIVFDYKHPIKQGTNHRHWIHACRRGLQEDKIRLLQSMIVFMHLGLLRVHFKTYIRINFPVASTQTPQGCLPPATQERCIRPELAVLVLV